MELYLKSFHTVTEHPMEMDHRLHTHNDHEIFCFLAGEADYFVEGNRYRLHRGDLMLMRKGEAHHLIPRSDARYERMVINFDEGALTELDPEGTLVQTFRNRPLGKYNHYTAALFPDNRWMFYMEKICAQEEPHRKLCYLLPLLSDLAEAYRIVRKVEPQEEPDRISAIIRYINAHLAEPLSLESLSQRFYLSKTHLNRLFRQGVGTTVWSYIVTKRLFLARELLSGGETPSRVYLRCGFQDYTAFYRAYKNHFGVSPRGGAIRDGGVSAETGYDERDNFY